MSLYLSGGGAWGAWQAGVISQRVQDGRKYKEVVGVSAGALNASTIALTVAQNDGKWINVPEMLKRFWTESVVLPHFAELALRKIFIMACMNSIISRFEAIHQLNKVKNMWSSFENVGKLVRKFGKDGVPSVGILIYMKSCDRKVHVDGLGNLVHQTLMVYFDHEKISLYAFSMKRYEWQLHGEVFTDSIDDKNLGKFFLETDMGSASMPQVFPTTSLRLFDKNNVLRFDMMVSDGAVFMYVPYPLNHVSGEHYTEALEFVVCYNIWIRNDDDDTRCIDKWYELNTTNYGESWRYHLSHPFDSNFKLLLMAIAQKVSHVMSRDSMVITTGDRKIDGIINDHFTFLPFVSSDGTCTTSVNSFDFSRGTLRKHYDFGVHTEKNKKIHR